MIGVTWVLLEQHPGHSHELADEVSADLLAWGNRRARFAVGE